MRRRRGWGVHSEERRRGGEGGREGGGVKVNVSSGEEQRGVFDLTNTDTKTLELNPVAASQPADASLYCTSSKQPRGFSSCLTARTCREKFTQKRAKVPTAFSGKKNLLETKQSEQRVRSSTFVYRQVGCRFRAVYCAELTEGFFSLS